MGRYHRITQTIINNSSQTTNVISYYYIIIDRIIISSSSSSRYKITRAVEAEERQSRDQCASPSKYQHTHMTQSDPLSLACQSDNNAKLISVYIRAVNYEKVNS